MNNIHTTVIDAGGRFGLHPSWSKFKGELNYHLFEPDKIEADRLIEKYTNRSDVTISNLALLDKTIKEIRLSMMKKKQWENSIIIITSDHQLRDNMNSLNNEEKEICKKREKHLIPFIVKIPNSKPCIYDKTFHACILKDMVLNMLQGKITNNKDLCEFIDENRRPMGIIGK